MILGGMSVGQQPHVLLVGSTPMEVAELHSWYIYRAIKRLNEMVRADQPAVQQLLETRVPLLCPESVEEAGAVTYQPDKDGQVLLGLLGVINGVFGSKEDPAPVQAVFDTDGKLTHFRRSKKS